MNNYFQEWQMILITIWVLGAFFLMMLSLAIPSTKRAKNILVSLVWPVYVFAGLYKMIIR